MNWLIPGLIAVLLVFALIKGASVYEAFVRGAADGLPVLLKILPCMAAMLIAIKVVRASGALDAFIASVSPWLQKTGFSPELVPLFVLRPFSGSAAMSLLADVLKSKGPDSFEGVAASIPVALICGVIGAVLAVIAARRMFAL